MNRKPNCLEQAFDRLSSFPFFNVRRLFFWVWGAPTILWGVALLLEGIAFLFGKVELRPEWSKNFILWAGVNPVFAYILHLWKKRELENKENAQKNQ